MLLFLPLSPRVYLKDKPMYSVIKWSLCLFLSLILICLLHSPFTLHISMSSLSFFFLMPILLLFTSSSTLLFITLSFGLSQFYISSSLHSSHISIFSHPFLHLYSYVYLYNFSISFHFAFNFSYIYFFFSLSNCFHLYSFLLSFYSCSLC